MDFVKFIEKIIWSDGLFLNTYILMHYNTLKTTSVNHNFRIIVLFILKYLIGLFQYFAIKVVKSLKSKS